MLCPLIPLELRYDATKGALKSLGNDGFRRNFEDPPQSFPHAATGSAEIILYLA